MIRDLKHTIEREGAEVGMCISRRRLAVLVATALAWGLVSVLVVPVPARAAVGDLFTAELTAAAEVPRPGPEGATGAASLTSYIGRVEIFYEITIDGLAPDDVVTAADIHLGREGVAGAVVLSLFTEPPSSRPASGSALDFDPQLPDELLANPGDYYVDVHTQAYPDGAMRGQLELALAGFPPGACPVRVEPSTVAVGQDFVVSGEFGGYAEIYLVPGEAAELPDESEPAATIPEGVYPVSVTLTAQADDEGIWTVWALRPETRGCGDSEILTIVAATPAPTPAAATGSELPWLPAVLGLLVLVLAIAAAAWWTLSRRPDQ